MNEELQSSNEELETSKEEIQSVNEELHTVNAQLSTKVDELDRANSDLRNLFESTRVATVFLDQHLVIRAFTPDVASIYNLIPSDRGRPLTDIVSRLDYDGLRDDVAEVLHTLEPLERRVSRRDGTAHYLLRILPYRTPDSTVDGSLVTFVDVTRIVQAEQHQRLLVDELNHRVKNMLAVVISLATQTLRRSGTLEEFSGVFLGRVHALTAAYTLLSRESWSGVQLQEVIEEEMRPFMAGDRANIRIEGPPVPLDPRGALALGMAVHELATNAAKYGALSVPEGDVAVTWTLERRDGGDHLALDWTERNGPPVTAPAKRGFGTVLIERGLAQDLSGEAKVEFLPGGVRASVRAVLRTEADQPAATVPADDAAMTHPGACRQARAGRRGRDACVAAGRRHAGRCRLRRRRPVRPRGRRHWPPPGWRRWTWRLLDVNVAGEMVFPVAYALGGTRHPVPVRDRLRPGGPAAQPPALAGLRQAIPAPAPGRVPGADDGGRLRRWLGQPRFPPRHGCGCLCSRPVQMLSPRHGCRSPCACSSRRRLSMTTRLRGGRNIPMWAD